MKGIPFERFQWVAVSCQAHETLDNPILVGLIMQALTANRVVTMVSGLRGPILVSWLRQPIHDA